MNEQEARAKSNTVSHEIRMEYGTVAKFQSQPVAEGRNGDFMEDLIPLLAKHLKGVNAAVPSRETSLAITKLEEAWFWLKERQRLRQEQGVQGTYKVHQS